MSLAEYEAQIFYIHTRQFFNFRCPESIRYEKVLIECERVFAEIGTDLNNDVSVVS